jgi:hypothetical protein
MECIFIPMYLDEFTSSPDCCERELRIATYTQLNYTSLRLERHLIQHNVLDHVEFNKSSPVSKTPSPGKSSSKV